MSENKPKKNEDVCELTEIIFPSQYDVIFYNDDYTTMEFVVEVLINIFHKSPIDADNLMTCVHTKGQACVGTYCYDVAKTKKDQTIELARSKNFPLRVELKKD